MTNKNVEKTFTDPKTGKFTKNNPGGGRPKGQRNYKTIYRDALIKIAKATGKNPDEFEDDIVQMALAKARKGDSVFYKDIMDRLHGKPTQTIDSRNELILIDSNKKEEINKALEFLNETKRV